ncbi:hypothetical protein Tco_0731343 [Tanacetum coccineum]
MWVIRIKQYFQVQDYALWEVIENVPVTAEENTNKKNDVKARSLLLMALPNEHQLTFSQYTDAKTMFAAIKTRFVAIALADATRRRQSVENVQTYTRRRREVSTGSGGVEDDLEAMDLKWQLSLLRYILDSEALHFLSEDQLLERE